MMYEYTPQKDTRAVMRIITVLFIGAAVLMFTTAAFGQMPFRWVFQLVSILLVTAGIFLMTRYVSKSFAYGLRQTDSGVDLVITEIQRKSRITVCRLSIEGINKICVFDSSQKDREKALKAEFRRDGRKMFDYCAEMHPKKFIWICAEECRESLAIKISYNEKFFGMLDSFGKNEKQ